MALLLFLQLQADLLLAGLQLGGMPPLLMLQLDCISLLLEHLHEMGCF